MSKKCKKCRHVKPPRPRSRVQCQGIRSCANTLDIGGGQSGSSSLQSHIDHNYFWEAENLHEAYCAERLLALFCFIACALVLVFIVIINAENKAEIETKRLEDGICIKAEDVINDQEGLLTDTTAIQEAIDYFYQETGIQPYLYLCSNIEGKGGDLTAVEAREYLAELYDSLFSDGGHLILAFVEYSPSNFDIYTYAGDAITEELRSEIDETIQEIVDKYSIDTTLDAYFNLTFTEAADKLMHVSKGSKIVTICGVTCSALLFGVFVSTVVSMLSLRKQEKELKLQLVLNTPLDKLVGDDLKHKYQA